MEAAVRELLGTATALLLAVCLLAPRPVGRTPTRAAIRGRVTDTARQALPNAWITLAAPGRTMKTYSDAAGHYELRDVAADTYTLRASLNGFCDAVRETLTVGADETATADFVLTVAPVSESIFYEWTGFPDVVRRVDAIVYLHVDDVLDDWPWPTGGCASVIGREVRATALSVAKASAPGPVPDRGAFRFVWPQGPPANEAARQFDAKGRWPVRPGIDCIVFLNWVPKAGRHAVWDGGLVVPVNGGKISWVVGKDRSADGQDVGSFMARLRASAARFF